MTETIRILAVLIFVLGPQIARGQELGGYRCQVEYPVWGVQYQMSFDFSDGEEG